MPTRKQRRRELKSKRHQYEFVYVDADGNELDEAPPELVEQEEQRKRERTNGTKTAAASSAKGKKQAPRRGGRREPQPPSWNRAIKRSAILAAFFFVIISFGAHGNIGIAILQTLPIVLFYVPLMYYMDRWIYRRYQAKLAGGASTPAKKKA
jgi:hypothetical protein